MIDLDSGALCVCVSVTYLHSDNLGMTLVYSSHVLDFCSAYTIFFRTQELTGCLFWGDGTGMTYPDLWSRKGASVACNKAASHLGIGIC